MSHLSFEELAKKFVKATSLLDYSEWPESISVPVEKTSGFFTSTNTFWEHIKYMRDCTDASLKEYIKDPNYEGSTGWEYSMMMGFFHSKFYYSKYQNSKSYEHVNSSHSFRYDDHFNFESQECRDDVIMDEKIIDTIEWPNTEALKKRNELMRNGLYQPIFICNFHTHPLSLYPTLKKGIYTFFSPTDVSSFFSSNIYMTGLVTDQLWMMGKTSSSNIPSHSDLAEVTKTELYEPENLESKAGEVMRNYGIVLYTAKFGGSLHRAN